MREYIRVLFCAKAFSQRRRHFWQIFLAGLGCGISTLPALGLVGPSHPAPEFAPYTVMVLDSSAGQNNASFCTASIIAPDIVLTAAHCVSDLAHTQVFFPGGESKSSVLGVALTVWILACAALALLAVRSGQVRTRLALQAFLSLVVLGGVIAYYFLPKAAERLVFFNVAAIAINPGYRPSTGALQPVSIDLALLRLAKSLPPQFKPVGLTDAVHVKAGQPLRIVGFGHADEDERGTQGILRMGTLAVIRPDSPYFIKLIDPDGTGLGGCTGDSGAPVFLTTEPTLAAVTIRAKGNDGYSCGAMTEAVLAGPQFPWIRAIQQAWASTDRLTL